MTAVAGLVHHGRVHLAGDSAVTAGWELTLRPGGKVFRLGPYALGISGGLRGAQLVQYAFEPPEPQGDLAAFMATRFVDAIRDALKGGGYAKREPERENSEDNILVGVHGRLFTVWGQYGVEESSAPVAAIGCGQAYAIGALHATDGLDLPPRRRLTTALAAAERFNAAVRGPFTFASTPKASK